MLKSLRLKLGIGAHENIVAPRRRVAASYLSGDGIEIGALIMFAEWQAASRERIAELAARYRAA